MSAETYPQALSGVVDPKVSMAELHSSRFDAIKVKAFVDELIVQVYVATDGDFDRLASNQRYGLEQLAESALSFCSTKEGQYAFPNQTYTAIEHHLYANLKNLFNPEWLEQNPHPINHNN